MDYHAIHGHDVANFGTPGRLETRRVLTVSAADVDEALLSPAEDEVAAAAEGRIKGEAVAETHEWPAAARCFVSTGLPTLDGILAGVLPPEAAASDSEEDGEDEAGTGAGAAGLDDGKAAVPSGSQRSRKRRRTPPPGLRRGTAAAGGVRRGQLTEIWGPPGAGKTTFGMQLVASALRDGGRAVWIDCSTPLCMERLSAVIDAQQQQQTPPPGPSAATGTSNTTPPPPLAPDAFVRYVCPSLPHWIALLCAPPAAATPHPAWLPPGTTLLVIDALSALVNYALPRTAEGKVALMANGKKGPTPYEKRTQVLQYITAALERLAETCRLAVVVLTQCASRVGGGPGRNNAGLAPALNAVVWDRAIAARLVLFRDWAWIEEEDEAAAEAEAEAKKRPAKRTRTSAGGNNSRRPVGGRFVGVQKVGRAGSAFGGADSSGFGHDAQTPGGSSSRIEHVVGFGIHEAGLVEVPYSTQAPPDSRRQRGGAAGRSDGDDDDSDYGWDDDDSMPRMPPQWQGSEDLLLGGAYGEDEEGEEGEEDEEEQEEEEETKEGDGNEEESTEEATPGFGVVNGALDSSGRLGVLHDAWPPRQPARRRGSQSVADSEDDSDF